MKKKKKNHQAAEAFAYFRCVPEVSYCLLFNAKARLKEVSKQIYIKSVKTLVITQKDKRVKGKFFLLHFTFTNYKDKAEEKYYIHQVKSHPLKQSTLNIHSTCALKPFTDIHTVAAC